MMHPPLPPGLTGAQSLLLTVLVFVLTALNCDAGQEDYDSLLLCVGHENTDICLVFVSSSSWNPRCSSWNPGCSSWDSKFVGAITIITCYCTFYQCMEASVPYSDRAFLSCLGSGRYPNLSRYCPRIGPQLQHRYLRWQELSPR